ncbi:hypothetical protein EPAKOI_005245 (plasmid) [Cupriavidus sp. H18C2]
MPNGDSLCANCEDMVARAKLYRSETTNASLQGYLSHMRRLNGVAVEDGAVNYLSSFFGR